MAGLRASYENIAPEARFENIAPGARFRQLCTDRAAHGCRWKRKLPGAPASQTGIGVNFLCRLVVSHVEADADLTYDGRLDLE
jgi:hypothetical protein